MSDQVGNQNAGFLTSRLIFRMCSIFQDVFYISGCVLYFRVCSIFQDVFYIKHGIWFQYLCTILACVMGFGMIGMLGTQQWNITRVSQI